MFIDNEIRRIVLLADKVTASGVDMKIFDRELDKPDFYYVAQLRDAIITCGYEVILYHSPVQFLENLSQHRSDLVFPYWFGQDSRNRHALVPAICEAYNIPFIGADAYTKLICNDKHLSKLLCKQMNLSTPNFCVWSSAFDTPLLNNLRYPCVVKPNFEGTSLGIGNDNLVYNVENAALVAKKLFIEFQQPVLIEEFVSGKEVSICLIGQHGNLTAWTAAERYIEDDESFFLKNLYSYKEKKAEDLLFNLRNVEDLISEKTLADCIRLFKYLDKVEFMRIDGKLQETDFHIIELTPETHLGDDSEFCGTFIATSRYSYVEVIQLLIQNCLEGYRNQNASK